MIERLLAAEAALARGELERAERLFAQVADIDARNAIAVVGLARISARRGNLGEATALLERALAIDPDEAAAKRLQSELDARPAPATDAPALAPARDAPALAPSRDAPTLGPARDAPALAPARAKTPPSGHRSLLDRIRSWLALPRPRR